MPIPDLINRLGNDNYITRQDAYRKLQQLGYEKLQHLQDNFDNPDIEIALSCQTLYHEYYYVEGPNGKLPKIWYLPHNIRYPRGITYIVKSTDKIAPAWSWKEVTKCEIDISLRYFSKAVMKIGLLQCVICGYLIEVDKGHLRLCEECCEECQILYNQEDVELLATRMFIEDMLNRQISRLDVTKIVNEACYNEENYSLMYCPYNQKAYSETYIDPASMGIETHGPLKVE